MASFFRSSTALLRQAPRPAGLLRSFASPPPAVKVPVALISQLRQKTQVTMGKAKEALAASNLDLDGALAWLEKDLVAGGAAKQAKLAGRTTKEGLIAVGVIGEGWGRRGGILEMNCETSFVYRTPGFIDLLQSALHTSIFFHNPPTVTDPSTTPASHLVNLPPSNILSAPLLNPNPNPTETPISTTAASQITSLVTTTGEKIAINRSAVFAPPTSETHKGLFYPAFFAHTPSGVPSGLGSPAAFVVLHLTGKGTDRPSASLLRETEVLGRALARQMVGVPSLRIYPFKGGVYHGPAVEGTEVFVEQHFMFYSGPEAEGGKSVGEVLNIWGEKHDVEVRIDGAERWVVGEGAEILEQES